MKGKQVKATTAEELARALGLSEIEAQEWKVQHALLKKLRQAVTAQQITHAEIAKKAGSSRTRVTAILNGNLDNVSSDLLIRLLGAVGYAVRVSPRSPGWSRPSVRASRQSRFPSPAPEGSPDLRS